MNWLNYHLGGKQRLLKMYRNQKDFIFEIAPISYELKTTIFDKSYKTVEVGYLSKIFLEDKSYYIGEKSFLSGIKYCNSYNNALMMCLTEFEHYTENKIII